MTLSEEHSPYLQNQTLRWVTAKREQVTDIKSLKFSTDSGVESKFLSPNPTSTPWLQLLLSLMQLMVKLFKSFQSCITVTCCTGLKPIINAKCSH